MYVCMYVCVYIYIYIYIDISIACSMWGFDYNFTNYDFRTTFGFVKLPCRRGEVHGPF